MFFKNRSYFIARLSLILLLLGGLLAGMPVPAAQAGVLVVTNLFDSGPGSLRQAIADAMPGDTITFDPSLSGEWIVLSSSLLITKDLTIDGSGLTPRLNLSGSFRTRIMEVNYPAHVTISGLILQHGNPSGHGGAVYSEGEFTAIDTMFFDNRAGDGGAIWGGRVKVINSTFAGNFAYLDGGAIFGVNLDIRNTTFAGNHAQSDGGAISVLGDGSATISNSTVFQNLAGSRGGGIFMTGYPRVSILNSTFAENTAVTGDEFALGQTYLVTFANTVFVCNASSEACYVPAGNPIINTNSVLGLGTMQDYGLAALAYRGGYTETMALLSGSPLIDAGDDATCANEPVNNLDQRGAVRPQGSHCDIGAYEYNAAPPITPSYVPPLNTSTATETSISTSTTTNTATVTGTSTPFRTSTPTNTRTSFCNVAHGALTIYGNVMSLRITNQTGISLAVEEIYVSWDHDRGHSEGNDKTVRLLQARLDSTPFWTGDGQGPSLTIIPANLSIPTGESTIRFTFHQSYDRSDGSEEFLLSWRPNICHNYPIHASGAILATPSPTPTNTWLPTASDTATITPTGTPTATPTPNKVDINVSVGGSRVSSHSLLGGHAIRVNYPGVNNGPVKMMSTFMRSILGSESMIYRVNGVNTGFSEMMGLPASQLDTTYWLPWYNNVDLDTQLRLANVSTSSAIVRVYIGDQEMNGSPFTLVPGASTRKSFAGVNNGPVKIVSTHGVPIVASERVIYRVNGVHTSFSEMMALPDHQLDASYYLPWYNNVDLDTQLRVANVSTQPAMVRVFVGGIEMIGSPFSLPAGESMRKSFAGVNNGPVRIVSTQNIVVTERVIYKLNGVNTSFSEMMALPNSQQDTTFWLPWYNNVDLATQLRVANVSSSTATIRVYIGGIEMVGSPFTLAPGASTRKSFAGVNNGPVKIVSTQTIVATERVIYKVNGIPTSFSEMMGLPNSLLDTAYWFPWYNNVDLATQLRFGVP